MERLSEQLTLHSTSEEHTATVGRALGQRITRGMCICVTGSLGSGKSVLVRGICRGLGVDESVISPSFILCEEYAGRLPVVHSDFYRLEHEREIEALGLFDRLDGRSVVLVEWGDRSATMIREADLIIHLAVTGESERSIELRFSPDDRDIVEGL